MSLFEHENTMESLSKMGNPLVVLKDIVDFEQFRSILESLFTNDHKKSKAGYKLWNDHPHKKCHKDVDARWTKKGGAKYYGYKDHAKVDLKTKIITDFVVTSANVHD